MSEMIGLITNSFGALGKALDLIEFSICVVNANINKPLIAGARHADKAKIIEAYRRFKLEMIDQNFGRIRRGHGRKGFFVYGLTQDEFGELLEIIKLDESFDSVTAVYVPEKDVIVTPGNCKHKVLTMTEETAYTSLMGYLTDNVILFTGGEKPKRRQNGMSRRQRAENKAISVAMKAAKKVEKAKAMLLNGETERAVSQKMHISRLSQEDKCVFWDKVYGRGKL